MGDGVPQTFSLSPNYPNPFNSSTVVRFAWPVTGDVDLAVYNLAGQRVAQLARGVRAAGNYSVNWDGCDQSGTRLASGVYLVRLQSGANVAVRKLTLLK